jgi:hypothetical protein
MIRKFRWFWSRSSGSSDLEVQKVLVQSYGGFGPYVPVVLVEKFRRLWYESSRGSGPELLEVLV